MAQTPSRILFACLAIACLSPAISEAALKGNQYTSLSHEVSLSRPDESWELRESPAKAHAVAAFSNGEGRALALLLHIAVKPREVISSPIDLRERWSELASMIAAAANAGEGKALIQDSRYDIVDGGIKFDIYYAGSQVSGATDLANWVSGQIIRDTQDRQHIFAVRCASSATSFEAWETQFQRIVASLEYQGARAATVYTDPPIPLWWWFAGVGAALVIVFFATRRRDNAPMHRLKHPVAIPGMAPAGIGGLPPEQMGMGGMDSGIPNVPNQYPVHRTPDSFGAAADLGTPADLSNVPDSVFYTAGVSDQLPTTEQLGNSPEFWKCSCGRVNPGHAGHCMRCDALKRVS